MKSCTACFIYPGSAITCGEAVISVLPMGNCGKIIPAVKAESTRHNG